MLVDRHEQARMLRIAIVALQMHLPLTQVHVIVIQITMMRILAML